VADRCPCCGAEPLEQRPECAARQRDMLAGGIRSFLTSLPFQPPEAIGFQARVKLHGALDSAGIPLIPEREDETS